MQAAASAVDKVGDDNHGFELLTITPPKKKSVESVRAACLEIFNIQKNVSEHSKHWTSSSLKNDFRLLDGQLPELDLVELDEESKRGLIPTLCKVYRALEQLRQYSSIDERIALEVRKRQGDLKVQCFGLGDELCQLVSLVDLGQSLAEAPHPEQFLLDVKDKVDLTTIPESKAYDAQQKTVYYVIQTIVSHLKKEEVVRHFTVPQLMYMKMGVIILMANYVFHQRKGLSQSEHIFQELLEAHQHINQILAHCTPEQFAPMQNDSSLRSLTLLKDALSQFPSYPKDFWDNPRHIQELCDYLTIMPAYRQFIADPLCHDLNGELTFITKDEENGLALYELPNLDDVKSDKPKAVVVFSYKKDSQGAYWNCLQNREAMLGLGGLAHAPVLAPVKKCKEALDVLLKKYKDVPLITAGFGVDGAVAQVLAYLWATDHSKVQTRTYAMGTALFLDVDAAPNFLKCQNHYGINFILHKDLMLNQSLVGKKVQKEYASTFHEYTLFNRDWFITDFSGHNRELYIGNLQKGIRQPQVMHGLYTELKEILKIVGLTKGEEKSKALHKYFQQFIKV